MQKTIFKILMLMLIVGLVQSSQRDQVIQQQIEDLMQQIKGKGVGMLTNPTSVDGSMTPLFDKII